MHSEMTQLLQPEKYRKAIKHPDVTYPTLGIMFHVSPQKISLKSVSGFSFLMTWERHPFPQSQPQISLKSATETTDLTLMRKYSPIPT